MADQKLETVSFIESINYSNLIEILAVFLGAALIIWQVNRQHRDNIKLQKENLKNDLKIKLHSEIEETLEKISEYELDCSSYVRKIDNAFFMSEIYKKNGWSEYEIKERAIELNNKNGYLSNAVANLLLVIEKYEIICPKLYIFNLAFNSALYDTRRNFGQYYSEVLKYLPMDPIENANSKGVLRPPYLILSKKMN